MVEKNITRNVKQDWARFIDGFCTPETDDEGKRRITLLVSLSAIGIFSLALFGSIAIFQGNLLLVTADSVAFAVLLLNLHDARRRKRIYANTLIGAVFVGAFYTLLFVSGGEKNTAFVWCYSYPLITCYLLGARPGGIVAFSLLFPVLLFFLFDPGPPFAVYTSDFKLRFLFSYLLVGGFSFLFEYTRERNREELRRTQSALENTIRELNAAKDALKASMEGTLRASEERYRALFSRAGDGIFIMSPDGKLIDVNESFARMHGYTTRELLRMNIKDLDTPETSKMMSERMRRLLAGETLTFEVERYHKDGHVFPNEVSASLVSFGGGSYVQGFHRDITERKRLEEEAGSARERMQFLLSSNPAVVYTRKPSGNYAATFVSEGIVSQFGYTPSDFVEDPGFWARNIHPEDAPKVFADITHLFEAGHHTHEYRFLSKDGTYRWVHDGMRLIRDADGNPREIVGSWIDITRRKQAEEEKAKLEAQLQHAQKMEGLGVLAGGIAHDFNNLLTVVLGHTELALNEIPPGSPIRENLTEIETAARRAADLSLQMLAYAGKAAFTVERVGLPGLVEEMAHLLKSSVSKKAILTLNLERDLPPIEADPSQIRQVVMNLIINASEAIGNRNGVITVSVGTMRHNEERLRNTELYGDLAPGRPYVQLEVTDTGSGMDEKTRSRIFDPFFSTKFTGRGLGLAAVLGIVRAHKGAVNVCSEPGKGTRFTVLLPALEDEAEEARTDESSPVADWQGKGTILLVDDEESLLGLGARMLEHLGFSVLTAADGRQAVDLYRERGKEIDLVLMDLTMPRMDGSEAFGELRRLDPDVKVVLASGYSQEDVASRFAGSGPSGVLQKPYTLAGLRESLAGLMPKRL